MKNIEVFFDPRLQKIIVRNTDYIPLSGKAHDDIHVSPLIPIKVLARGLGLKIPYTIEERLEAKSMWKTPEQMDIEKAMQATDLAHRLGIRTVEMPKSEAL